LSLIHDAATVYVYIQTFCEVELLCYAINYNGLETLQSFGPLRWEEAFIIVYCMHTLVHDYKDSYYNFHM